MEAQTIAIGIDLGTTNSVMARMERKTPRVLDNQDSEPLTPSVVHLTESGEIIVGKQARAYGGREPDHTVFSIKRFMGRNFDDPEIQMDIQRAPYKVVKAKNGEVEVILRGKAYSPADISSYILKAMKADAEVITGVEVTHAVITVPAYFGNRQRQTTREAGRLAGLSVMRIIPEPTAAALAYGIEAGMAEPKNVLVYDLGGGTFDVTVMNICAGSFLDLGKTGDMHLGGDDFDHKIMDWIIQKVKIEQGVDLHKVSNPAEVMFQLKIKAEEAKIRLGRSARTSILIPSLVRVGSRSVDVELELTRDEFNRLIDPLVTHSIDLVRLAITRANATINEIDSILLVGGSTKVPLVEESLRKMFGDKVIRSNVNAMHCVAQGAAIQTLLPPEIVEDVVETERETPSDRQGGVIDVPSSGKDEPKMPDKECPECGKLNPGTARDCVFCNASLTAGVQELMQTVPVPIGIQTEGDEFFVMLDEHTYYPTREPVAREFRTIRPGQDRVHIPIYEGWKPKASDNDFLGEASGELPAGLPEGTRVIVSMSIDQDGILYVNAMLPDKPGVHIKGKMDWKNKAEQPPNGGGDGGGGGGGGGGGPKTWRDEANGVLLRAGLVVSEAEDFLPDQMLAPIRQIGTQLKTAVDTNDQANGKALIARLEPEVEKLGIFMILGFARHLSQDPELSVKVGLRNADALSQAVAKADRYKQSKDIDNFIRTVDQEVMKALEPYLAVLGDSGGMGLNDLLKASSGSNIGMR